MKRSITALCVAVACISSSSSVEAFAPLISSAALTCTRQTPSAKSSTSLNVWLPDEHALSSASSFISTVSADIDNIPDDEFGKVFAGGIGIMFGSILSTIFVGFLVESGYGGYADLVAESYAGQDLDDGKDSFLNSLGLVSLYSTSVNYII